ncbi:MAG: long-chain fatty acid--CoA ligase [Rubrobacteraceae bacterium]
MNANVLERRASYHPDRPAVCWRGCWISYGELYERARRAAGVLAGRGVEPGDRVGLLASNHPAYLDLLFAAPLLGFTLAPFNNRLGRPELRELAAYIRPKITFYGPGFSEIANDMDNETLPLEALQEEPAGEFTGYQPGVEDVALLLFTGGTTGLPKAAMISYRQLLLNAFNTAFAWGVTGEDRCIVSTPMFHAAVNALATPLLYLGGSVIVQENFDPGEYLEWVETYRPTLIFMVPTMYQMLYNHPRFDQTDFSGVRWAISGGSPCPAPVRGRFGELGVRFKQGYGMTEAGVNCFHVDLDEAERHPESVGRPMPHLWGRVSDAEGAELPDGIAGELCLSGPVLMNGYWELEKETAEVLRPDEEGRTWLHTGDLAYRDEAGRYFIVGRKKEMFISGGENVYPAEVEQVLYDHPQVAECAVVGVPDDRWGEIGLAAIVQKPESHPEEGEIEAFARERLAGYKIPKRWVFLDELPKSGAGKILKRDLAERHGAGDQ